MITAVPVRSPARYLSKHLVHADYYSEQETVEGEWMGKSAELLKLGQGDFAEEFAKVGNGEVPYPSEDESEKLVQRVREDAVAYRDLGISAPKDYSVLAMLGKDERLEEIFKAEVKEAVKELERFSARRFRDGKFAHSKENKVTGNIAAAVFIHQSSRALEPQLHAHVLVANATRDEEQAKWYALETGPMMAASVYIRERFYHRLSHRIEELGYRTHGHSDQGFEIRGIENLRERFSSRTAQVEKGVADFKTQHGRDPSKSETQKIVLRTRDRKLKETTKEAIRESNLSKLNEGEIRALKDAVRASEKYSPTPLANARTAVERGIGHEFERQSVSSPMEILKSAYRLSDGLIVDDVHRHLTDDENIVVGGRGLEMTHQLVLEEERRAIEIADRGIDACPPLGTMADMEAKLEKLEAELANQAIKDHLEKHGEHPAEMELAKIEKAFSQDELRDVAKKLLLNHSRVSVLIGDAGTGKTFGMNVLQDVHLLTGGKKFSGLAPTGLARQQLEDEGTEAQTIQRFLLSTNEQENAAGKTLVLDEAGLVGTGEMAKFLVIAERINARVLLIGDTKQHDSVTRGSALRNLTEGSKNMPVARLATVRRQSDPRAKKISELMASGKFAEAIERQFQIGQLTEIEDDGKLFEAAAKAYVADLKEGKQPLVVIPTWKEIEMFNSKARAEMKAEGLLEGKAIEMKELRSLSRTDEERGAMKLYKPGDLLLFHKEVKGVGKDEVLTVESVSNRGLETVNTKGQSVTITRKQRKAFDVMEEKPLPVAKGDKIMLKANIEGVGLNGEILAVKEASPTGLVVENATGDRKAIPLGERRLTYGHAITSHRAQGQSKDSSISVMGKLSIGVASPKQYYVSNTRYKDDHKVFVSDRQLLTRNLLRRSSGKKLGREIMLDLPERERKISRPKKASVVRQVVAAIRIRIARIEPRKFSVGHTEDKRMRERMVRIAEIGRWLSHRAYSRLMEIAKGRKLKPGETIADLAAKESVKHAKPGQQAIAPKTRKSRSRSYEQ